VGSGVSTAAKTASGDSGQAVRHHSVSLFASWSTSIWLNQLSVSSEVVHTSSFGPWIRCKGIRAGSTRARKRSCVFCWKGMVVGVVVVVLLDALGALRWISGHVLVSHMLPGLFLTDLPDIEWPLLRISLPFQIFMASENVLVWVVQYKIRRWLEDAFGMRVGA